VEAVCDLLRRSGETDIVAGGLQVDVTGPEEGLPALPAAVETSAYRIALEGLTNAARHSQAQHCSIQFRCETDPHFTGERQLLLVQISDDGVGLPANYRAGVGLRSMRERAEELGGGLEVKPGIPTGTIITGWLPLAAGPSYSMEKK
jgi:signal transduction histidine kinase